MSEEKTKKSAKEVADETLATPIVLSSGADYWDFESEPVFRGRYTGDDHYIKDKDAIKDGAPEDTVKMAGYVFVDEDEEVHVITDSHNIRADLDKVIPNRDDIPEEKRGKKVRDILPLMEIEFLGQKEHGEKRVNQYKISIVAW